MSNATDTAITRRPRAQVQIQVPVDPNATPAEAAKSAVSSVLESLHPTFASIVSRCAEKFFTLYGQYLRRKRTNDTFTTEFVPRSARISVDIQGSSSVRELDAFQQQVTLCKEKIATFQSETSKIMQSVAALELQQSENEYKKYLLLAVVAIARGFIIVTDGLESTDYHCYILLVHVLRSTKLRALLPYENAAALDTMIQQHVSLPSADQRATLDRDKEKFSAQGDSLKRILNGTFPDAITAYTTAVKNQEIKKQMAAVEKLLDTEKPTAEVAQILDEESKLDADTINKLIEKKVAEATTNLRKQVKQLSTTTKSKNGKRGAPTRTPSPKTGRSTRTSNDTKTKSNSNGKKTTKSSSKSNNKANKSKTKTTSPKRTRGRKADDAGNDSKGGKPKQSRNDGKKPSQKRNKSQKRPSKRSNQK
jgi:hypothetical protein